MDNDNVEMHAQDAESTGLESPQVVSENVESSDSPWTPRQIKAEAKPPLWSLTDAPVQEQPYVATQPSAGAQPAGVQPAIAQPPTTPSSDFSGFQPPVPQKSSAFTGKHIALIVIISLVTALLGAGLASFLILGVSEAVPQFERIISTEARETLGIDTGTELSVNVASKVLPSVVSVSVEQQQMTFMGNMIAEGSGSGVIIQENGYILTNYHVIENGTRITVTAGAKEYEAEVIGVDPTSDLAVLKIDTHDLPAIDIGTSGDLRVGQYVMAVGNPFGLSESVSVGIISALGRTEAIRSGDSLAAYANLIQTDAAINPGNSGGALVDADGRLIGINTLIRTTSGSNAGVGFAIPIDTALDIAHQLMEGGTASHSFLGVSTQTLDAVSAQQFKMPVEAGAYIVEVIEDSPAYDAGLQKGDIIIRIGDKTVKTSEDVFGAVRSHKVGDTVEVEYYRGDDLKVVKVTLGSDERIAQAPREESSSPTMPEGQREGSSQQDPHEGFLPQELIDLLREYGFTHNW